MTPSDASLATPKRPGSGTIKQSSTYTYDADGNVATQVLNYPDVTNTAEGTYTYTYDRAGRLTRFNQASAATTTSDYRWDPANNRTAVVTNATVQAWTYDARNRIMTAPDGTYTWDPRGTLDKVVNGGGTTVVDATFDGFGRMTAMTTGSTNIGVHLRRVRSHLSARRAEPSPTTARRLIRRSPRESSTRGHRQSGSCPPKTGPPPAWRG